MRARARSAPASAAPTPSKHPLFDTASSTPGLSVDGGGHAAPHLSLQRFVHAVHVCDATRARVDIVAQHPLERQGGERWNMQFSLWRAGGDVIVSVHNAAGQRLCSCETAGSAVKTSGSARILWNVSHVCRRARVVDEWVSVTRVDRGTVRVHAHVHGPTGEGGWFVRRSFLASVSCGSGCKLRFHFHIPTDVGAQHVVGLVGDRLSS